MPVNAPNAIRGSSSPTLRRRVFSLLDPQGRQRAWGIGLRQQKGSLLVEAVLVSVILVNSLALVLWTVPHLEENYASWFHFIEYCTVGIFLLEYALRFWTAPEAAYGSEKPDWVQRWRYLGSGNALVDAAALVPSAVAVAILLFGINGPSLSFLLAIRLLTRTAKLARYFPAARRLGFALRQKTGQLITAVIALLVALVVAATLMYFAEHAAQPEIFSSIPAAMWWSVVTLTTVGYGDTVPITPIGRLLAAVIAVLGIGLFALPAGILSAGLLDADARDAADDGEVESPPTGEVCPHCGQPMPDTTPD